jgi:PIN domain
MLSLRPYVSLESVRAALVEARRATTEVQNAPNVSEGFSLWQIWAAAQVRMLRPLLYEDDLNRLITTRLYWSLFGSNSNYLDSRALSATVQNEMTERQNALDAEVMNLDADLQRWGRGGSLVLIPDTTVLIEKGYEFPELNWRKIVEVREGLDIFLVITMAAIVELDGKKLSRENSEHGKSVRTGVRGALKRIEEMFPTNDSQAPFWHKETITSKVTSTLLTDDLAHVPLNTADAEMIQRGLDLLPYAGRAMLVTYDLNQAFRARSAGVESKRLRYGYEDERPTPEATPAI